MSLNLKNSAVHIKPVRGRLLTDGGSKTHFECFRCRRDLPDSEFEITSWARGGRAAYLHPVCYKCRRQSSSKFASHHLVTPALQSFVERLITSARSSASHRGLVFALSSDDVIERYIEQGGKCALTGVRMTYTKGSLTDKRPTALSIDRIHCERNYTIDNIHLVCRVVNIMRMDLSLEDFGEWCTAIVMHGLNNREPA